MTRCFCACRVDVQKMDCECSKHKETARGEGKEQRAMDDGLLVEILALLPINWNPPHCALMPLNHPLLTLGSVPNWHNGWHRFCWHGDGPLLGEEAFGRLRPVQSCCTSRPGKHYPVWHCLSLWVLFQYLPVTETVSGVKQTLIDMTY